MSFRLNLALAALLAASPVALAADPKADAELARTAQNVFKSLRTETLPNGLRVYLLPVKGSPVVSTLVAYRVGSGDEEKDQTGLSHYLEHLLFKGTDKLMPGDIDRLTQRNGGMNNAFTSEDMTVYFFDFAADRWQAALEIEADRMRNVKIDAKHEFEQEKGAVIAELDMYEDSPWDLESKALLQLLFPKDSPYSHPVIGQREHVRGATAEVIKRHYDKWYYPNNAAIVVVGGFDPDAALAKIKTLFGSIPAGELPRRKPATFHKDRTGMVRKDIESKFDVPRMLMGFNTIAISDPDDPVLDLLQTILAGGKTSRLYRTLVEDERLAAEVDASNQSNKLPGWFSIQVEMVKGKDRKKAEELVFAALEKMAKEPVTDEELARARRKILASFVFSRESVHSLGTAIARTSAYPGGEDIAKFYEQYLNRLLAVTKADIQKAAAKYLTRQQAAVVWSIPKEGEECGAGRTPNVSEGVTLHPVAHAPGSPRHSRSRSGFADQGGSGSFSLADAKRMVLPNGLTLILLEDHKQPIVVAKVGIKDVTLREPADKAGVATLMGSLLEEGTAKHTGKQIAQLIEDTGGALSMSASGGVLKVLTPDADLGLGLLFDSLMNPTFPQDAFERQKEQQLSAIDDELTQPQTKAEHLFHAAVYGKHPFGRPQRGTKETVSKLTAADCKAFHQLAFAPNATIAVLVGDFNAGEMAKKIESLTRDWKKSDQPAPAPPAPPKPTAVAETIVSDPAAAQVHVYLGHLGITRNNPDYYKLLVLDNVLGTGPGFTDRLSANLRDRQGLAYTVNATIAKSAGLEPGTFTGYIGTFPDKFTWVRDAFVKEINKIRDEPPTQQEVDDAKKYLLGSLPFRFTTTSAVADQLYAAERFGLGFDFLEKYRKEIEAVTPADVQAVARKYLDPKALAIIAVGPVGTDGKPLPKKDK